MIIIQFFKVIFLGTFGLAMTYLDLVRLGMWRHGTSGWEFLHLDWIFQPHLSYWGAHMSNLIGLGTSLILCIWSLAALYDLIQLCRCELKQDSLS